MFKLLLFPIFMGILLALLIFFALPLVVAEADIVSAVASSILDLSNSLYAHMPQPVADYLAHLNLLIVAITAGLLLAVFVFVLMLVVGVIKWLARLMIRWINSLQKEEAVKDLPPLELDERYKRAPQGKHIVGGNLDSIDSD